MVRTNDGSTERGQILIITAAAMVVLLGIAAIVVDLGMSWMLHRQEQNAVDPAAIAAARWLRDPVTLAPSWNQLEAEKDACFYAKANGFFEDDNASCDAALDTDALQVWSPPISGPHSGTTGFVQVIIRATHPSFFGRIYGQNEAAVTTDATVANTTGDSNSASLIALDPGCDGGPGGKISGNNATVEIIPASGYTGPGGYVHVNSSCATHPTGAPDACSNGTSDLKIDSANLITPHAYVHGECTLNGSGANLTCPTGITDCLTEGALQLGDPLGALFPPTFEEVNAFYGPAHCPSGEESLPTDVDGCELKSMTCADDGTPECELQPGIYYGGWTIGSHVEVKLEPGIYIIAGGGIRVNTGGIESVSGDPTVDARVMIFSTDNPTLCPSDDAACQGPIRMQANSDFAAQAINDNTCATQPITCPYRGILLWQDGRGTNPDAEVRLGGQNSSVVSGTIYAPKADVILNGGAGGTGCDPLTPNPACLAVQIIAWHFEITGGGYLQMPYDPAGLWQFPHRGLVD
ncbi:MAG: pilus assembly protein TadG-related protein [Candidatus Limnocylindria bacterium]